MEIPNTYLVRLACVLLLAMPGCTESGIEPENPEAPWLFYSAVDVNDSGVVVGAARLNDQWAGAIWAHGQPMRIVEGVNEFVGINDDGTAVGVEWLDWEPPMAHLWSEADGLVPLGPFMPTAIDETGTVTGYVTDPELETQTPVVVRAPGSVQYLTDVAAESELWGPARAAATDVSGGHYVVGILGTWAEAFIWSDTGGVRLLFPAERGSHESTARGVNMQGWVVGWSSELRKAYIWKGPDDIAVLEPLAGANPSWGMSCASAIRDDGVVVGSSANSEGHRRAVVWDENGVPTDLGFGEAVAINDGGLIVGRTTTQQHAVVWLADGTRLDLAGPRGTTLLGIRLHSTPQDASALSMSLPCP